LKIARIKKTASRGSRGKDARKALATTRNKRMLAADLHGDRIAAPVIVHRPPSAPAVRGLRRWLGLTQTAMSRQLKTTKMVVSTWETGTRSPNREATAKLRELALMNDLDLDLMSDPDFVNNDLELRVMKTPPTGTQLAAAFFAGNVK
jgi:DNA-binding transcriptional regulator YiaG